MNNRARAERKPITSPAQTGPDDLDWNSVEVSDFLLGKTVKTDWEIPKGWVGVCSSRLMTMRDQLRKDFAGFDTDPKSGLGPLLDWVLAAFIARENVLLLGTPGVAKSEIATRCFQLLGLSPPPEANKKDLSHIVGDGGASTGQSNSSGNNTQDVQHVAREWERREQHERAHQKYFHYLLSRFTQLEEICGPVDIALLRKGILARVNFGLMTGPGVRGAFLDEVFKASSSILNSLLTLIQERAYFNWGGMQPSDLAFFIGASNEMPGGFARGVVGAGSGSDDFQTLYAFLDRFPIRLQIPAASATRFSSDNKSDLARAFDLAMEREGMVFKKGERFKDRPSECPGINDILLLGRYCFQHYADKKPPDQYDEDSYNLFKTQFLEIATNLQAEATSVRMGNVTWTISPRKLRSINKIGLAHALVRQGELDDKRGISITGQDLRVFNLIWDTWSARPDLEGRTRNSIRKLEERAGTQ